MYERLLEIAKALPKDKAMRCKHVSFLVHKGKVVSIGQNQHKTHPIHLRNRKKNQNGIDFSENKPHCSEWSCIRQFCRMTDIPVQKCVLVNVRIDANGAIKNAKPCASCQQLIDAITPRKVFYTTDDGVFDLLKIR
jgi:hypothetical protein